MSDEQWHEPSRHCVGLLLAGDVDTSDDASVLLLLNAGDAIDFTLPHVDGRRWQRLLDTAFEDGVADTDRVDASSHLQNRSLQFLVLNL